MNKVVYIHIRNDTLKPFYVGMGNVTRPFVPNYRRNNHWNNIVKKSNGHIVNVVADGLSIKDALELEEFIIEIYGLNNLSNISKGGECPTLSKETKQKLREYNLGKNIKIQPKKKFQDLIKEKF